MENEDQVDKSHLLAVFLFIMDATPYSNHSLFNRRCERSHNLWVLRYRRFAQPSTRQQELTIIEVTICPKLRRITGHRSSHIQMLSKLGAIAQHIRQHSQGVLWPWKHCGDQRLGTQHAVSSSLSRRTFKLAHHKKDKDAFDFGCKYESLLETKADRFLHLAYLLSPNNGTQAIFSAISSLRANRNTSNQVA